MKLAQQIDRLCTQAEFAEIIGISQTRISQLAKAGIIPQGETALKMLLTYCERLREQSAGRSSGEVGGLDLVQERAALAREQRYAHELKNAVSRGEYAQIGLLADTLGRASSAVVDRFDSLEGVLRKTCPDISEETMMAVLGVVSSARNEWIRSTCKLIDETIDALTVEDEEE
jgi:phage terminase Nu1 subunit (DNA packaging protein)